MEILVTGPDGVLGSNLVRELLKRNYKVSVLLEPNKDPITLAGLDIKRYYGDILDASIIDDAIKGKDVVFHCAASTSVFPPRNKNVVRVNVEGTKNVIQAALKHSIKRLIYVGSAASFGSGDSEQNSGNEENPYTNEIAGLDYLDSKYEAQQLIIEATKKQKLPAIVVNPTFMIGPYDSKPSSGAMVIAIHKRKIPGHTVGIKNFVAVKDVAFAMANAINMGRIGECYILGNDNLSYKEAFSKIARVASVKGPRWNLPKPLVLSFGRINSMLGTLFHYSPGMTKELCKFSCENHYFSSEKARKELLLPHTPIEVAIKECYDWFKNNGYLDK
ncbi:MAG: NAD-dependent epimerase/dehydratase family protein [Bacteroidia bacterium]|nr:NAD-dependent epimerase/dehydratase family protein [Sphingobacteriaceae bacterium]MBP9068977.1 NAD-dependent epimerase/dehydratase family protein [Bacteroidia bacterium]